MTIHKKALMQYITVVQFTFQFSPVCNFEIDVPQVEYGTLGSERANIFLLYVIKILTLGLGLPSIVIDR